MLHVLVGPVDLLERRNAREFELRCCWFGFAEREEYGCGVARWFAPFGGRGRSADSCDDRSGSDDRCGRDDKRGRLPLIQKLEQIFSACIWLSNMMWKAQVMMQNVVIASSKRIVPHCMRWRYCCIRSIRRRSRSSRQYPPQAGRIS